MKSSPFHDLQSVVAADTSNRERITGYIEHFTIYKNSRQSFFDGGKEKILCP